MMAAVEGFPHRVVHCDEHLARGQLKYVKHIKIATTCRGETGLGDRELVIFASTALGGYVANALVMDLILY